MPLGLADTYAAGVKRRPVHGATALVKDRLWVHGGRSGLRLNPSLGSRWARAAGGFFPANADRSSVGAFVTAAVTGASVLRNAGPSKVVSRRRAGAAA